MQIISHYCESQADFARKIGERSNTVGNWLKRDVSPKVYEKILQAFPEVNKAWLITGEGNMLNDNSDINTLQQSTTKGVPYFENTEVTGSILSMYNDQKEIPTFYINYEHFNDCTAYIPVVGDSMYPKYCSGEIVAVKRINNMDAILWGETYLVVTNSNANDLRTIKDVHQCDQEGKIALRASNPNYKGDTIINKSDIISMFIIKGKIKRNQL